MRATQQSLTKTNDIYRVDEESIRGQMRRAESAGNATDLAIAQDALAHLYYRTGQARRGARIAEAALELLPVELITERVMLQNTRLLCELFAGRCAVVIDHSPSAIANAELLGNAYYRAQAHSNYASALAQTDETDRAFDHYTAAHYYFEGDAKRQAATDNNIACLLVKTGRAEDALSYLDRAQLHYEETENLSALGQTYETRARAYLALDQHEAAKDAIKLSLALIPEVERGIRAESVRTKAMIHEASGESDEAQACYLEAIELLSAG